MFNAASVSALTVGSLGSKRPVTGSGIGAGRLFRGFSLVFPLLGELLSVEDMAGSRNTAGWRTDKESKAVVGYVEA